MGFLERVALWMPGEHITDIATEIAERSRGEITQRVAGAVAAMSAAERRGYIRVRAANVIHREVDATLNHDRRLRTVDRAALVEVATEAAVTAVSAQGQAVKRRKVA